MAGKPRFPAGEPPPEDEELRIVASGGPVGDGRSSAGDRLPRGGVGQDGSDPAARTAVRTAAEEDAFLIRRYRGGDHLALEELVRRHYARVFNLANRLTNDPNSASDIVSEAFIRVQNALPAFRGESTFSTWLYRVVRNVFLDERKKARIRTHASLEELVETEDSVVTRQVEDPHPGPVAMLEESERTRILLEAVHSLPDTQRLMISLYHFQQLSYEEIAEIMELPIGTVKSRLNRARLALRSRLMHLRDVLGG